MKRVTTLFALLLTLSTVRADISMPVADNFYDKLGRGIANTAFASSEILDSHYTLLQTEGPTVAFTKGLLVQGPSRMVMDMGFGIFDILTAPFPLAPGWSYASMKQPPYDAPYPGAVINDYPPADLTNWY